MTTREVHRSVDGLTCTKGGSSLLLPGLGDGRFLLGYMDARIVQHQSKLRLEVGHEHTTADEPHALACYVDCSRMKTLALRGWVMC